MKNKREEIKTVDIINMKAAEIVNLMLEDIKIEKNQMLCTMSVNIEYNDFTSSFTLKASYKVAEEE